MKQNYTMENKLRSKEAAEQPDLAHVDQHWQQMQALLQPVSFAVKRNIYSRPVMVWAFIGHWKR